MNLEEIRQLIDLVIETGVAELEVDRQGDRVRIRRENGSVQREVVISGNPAAVTAPAPGNPAPAAGPAPPAAEASDNDPNLAYVRSPIVGTFYDAPSPGAPAFVKVGDTVASGQVLCIIESMKLMNEIESEVGGVIVGKFIENGKPAEYGQALFSVRPH
jgi:acetyl-CoA carboxylase biotin carboxyl carrier protein